MLRVFKSKIAFFFLGLIIASTIAVFAYSYAANNVGFTPIDTDWSVDNVKTALDDLNAKIKDKKLIMLYGDSKTCTTTKTTIPEPNFYDSDYLSFNTSSRIYTALKKFKLTIYMAHGYHYGVTGGKMWVRHNSTEYGKHFESRDVQTLTINVNVGDTINIQDSLDFSSSRTMFIAVAMYAVDL